MQQRKTDKAITGGFILALGLGGQASAHEPYADDDTHLNADVLAVFSWMNSRKNYDGTLGDFRTLHDRRSLDLDARELDLYVEWAATERLIITPLIVLYQPYKSARNGGNQVGGNGTHVYSQLVVAVPF
ncbi:hypothetical protein A7D27_18055 [Pseudomonas sp. 1D4]|nr:hypothetical protein A7D27_18055 [Pseudomonas sp. 1D4]